MILTLAILATVYALWVFYLAVMALWRAQRAGVLTGPALAPAYLTLAIGAALDCLMNLTLMNVVFLERPRKWLVTHRLKYHLTHSTGWRHSLAKWLCAHYLSPFDPTGNHCD